MSNKRDQALSGLDPKIRELLSEWGARERVAPEDPSWDVMSAIARGIQSADESNRAAGLIKAEVVLIPSHIKSAAREAGREMTRSMIRSHKMISFASAGGIVLLAILAGAVFCLLGLATTGLLNPTQFAIKPAPAGGVEIRAPGPVDAAWCQSRRRDCLLLKSKEKSK
ncbi:hypothetical protein [Methylohalobius crimeensis]|uniref:hypothetical protein n=1 Tax=Methylohalobius crimeensis TaxID=244365 RepID=UPI0003B67660|nr:hypothetical protein [Methylohalobius crimeensis]